MGKGKHIKGEHKEDRERLEAGADTGKSGKSKKSKVDAAEKRHADELVKSVDDAPVESELRVDGPAGVENGIQVDADRIERSAMDTVSAVADDMDGNQPDSIIDEGGVSYMDQDHDTATDAPVGSVADGDAAADVAAINDDVADAAVTSDVVADAAATSDAVADAAADVAESERAASDAAADAASDTAVARKREIDREAIARKAAAAAAGTRQQPRSKAGQAERYRQAHATEKRKGVIKTLAWILAIVAVAAGVFFLMYRYDHPGPTVAATVNGDKIYEDDVASYIARFRTSQNYQSSSDFASFLSSYGYNASTFRELIIRYEFEPGTIVRQEAAKAGVSVTDEEVDAKVAEYREKAGYTDASNPSWAAYVAQMGITEDYLRYEMETEALSDKWYKAVLDPVSKDEVESSMVTDVANYTSRKSSYILFSDEAQAEEVLAQLQSSTDLATDFAAAAKQYSIDSTLGDASIADEDGNVGWDILNTNIPSAYKTALNGGTSSTGTSTSISTGTTTTTSASTSASSASSSTSSTSATSGSGASSASSATSGSTENATESAANGSVASAGAETLSATQSATSGSDTAASGSSSASGSSTSASGSAASGSSATSSSSAASVASSASGSSSASDTASTTVPALSKGELSGVVQLDNGYAIIYCTDEFATGDTSAITVGDFPDDIYTYAYGKEEDSLWSTKCSDYLSGLEDEAVVVIKAMPTDAAYNVSVS